MREVVDGKRVCWQCMRNCQCTSTNCWCTTTWSNNGPVGLGDESYYTGRSFSSNSGKKGMCTCACGGVKAP